MAKHPYRDLPQAAYWKSAISERHVGDIDHLWEPLPLRRTDRIATAGSCFAQHIGNRLQQRGADFLDMEPAPAAIFTTQAEARKFGFGVYSCRYGNVYTSRQLLQLAEEAFEERTPKECIWRKGNRFFDALRPSVDPVGQSSEDDVRRLRATHLDKVRRMFCELDLFVFTLGLTEGWSSVSDGTFYPSAPGTICGEFDSQKYRFHNLRHQEVLADLHAFWARLKAVNTRARMLLTVSPVPLTATASGHHVLPASTYSKSVLRAVAGELADSTPGIYYFPSFEIISSHPFRAAFYDPNLRTVNAFGVDFVMSHFFSGSLRSEFTDKHTAASPDGELEIICDEDAIDQP